MGYHFPMGILVTGFTPFLGNQTNPSGEIARELDGYRGLVSSLVLDVSYKKAESSLLEKIKELKPSHILSLGLAAGAKHVRFERFAYNLKDGKYPDNDGITKINEKIDGSGADILSSSLEIGEMVSRFRDKGYPIRESDDPGRYICNLVYYLDLSSCPDSLFVHLPKEEVLPLEKGLALAKGILDELIEG